MSAVHPRLRGELGKRTSGFFPLRRFIPACAGNSLQTILISLVRSVHPRLRGELFPFHSATYVQPGSSPLARGTRPQKGPSVEVSRFIPACAGNSQERYAEYRYKPVHPRLRGELRISTSGRERVSGSSPLARGTQNRCKHAFDDDRFIPACAGNSRAKRHDYFTSAVHPRLRGELKDENIRNTAQFGSSPLARGTPLRSLLGPVLERFIPACAGNSASANCSWTLDSVHPRLRGELKSVALSLARIPGSSPLARGTPEVISPSGRQCRFIPACAGNSY